MSRDFFERLGRYASENPGQIALQSIDGDRRQSLSWSTLLSAVDLLGRRLQRIGITGKPTHVALLSEDAPMWGAAFLAAYSAGWVIVPLDPSRDSAALSQIVAHAHCQALMFSEKYAVAAQEISKTNSDLALVEISCAESARPLDARGPLPLTERDFDSDLAILYTGGTTGSPKGVRLTEANLFWSIRDMLAVCPITERDHILSILPLFHVMPLLANLLGPLYVGARVTYLRDRDPVRILNTFHRERITAFLCVPQFYYLLIRRIRAQAAGQPSLRRIAFHRLLDLSRFLRRRLKIRAGRLLFRPIHHRFGPEFRLFGVGAASFAPEAAEMLLDLGFNLFQAYGMTETAGLATVDPPGLNGGLTCGPSVPHARIRIHEPDQDGIGEILIAGEHVTPGYWREFQATAEVIRDGWLWSGDLGRIDRSGRLRVTGRRKEVIVLPSGRNIFPEQVEYQIRKRSELIKEICVLGLGSSDGHGERLHAVVVPDFEGFQNKGIVSIHDQIRYEIENATRALPMDQRIHSLEIRETPLPRTSTGKLQRFKVKPRLTSPQRQTEPRTSDPEEPALFTVIRRIKADCGSISLESHLELDLGFESLERVELLSNIRVLLGIEVSMEQAASIFTVGDLARIVGAATQTDNEQWAGWPQILRTPLSDGQKQVASTYLLRRPLLELATFMVCRLVGLAAKLLLRLQVIGTDQLPRAYPFLICANHASYLDALLIASALPLSPFRRLFFLGAKKYARTPIQRWLTRLMRAISIDAGPNAGPALRLAYEGLKQGLILCVFPEGHRSIDGSLLPFHKGPSILAIESGVPIVPVGIIGTQKMWGRASRRFRLSPVQLRFGPPIPSYNLQGEKLNPQELTARLETAIGDLIRTNGNGGGVRA